MKFLDTSVVIDIDRGNAGDRVTTLDDEGRHAISVVTMTELRLGHNQALRARDGRLWPETIPCCVDVAAEQTAMSEERRCRNSMDRQFRSATAGDPHSGPGVGDTPSFAGSFTPVRVRGARPGGSSPSRSSAVPRRIRSPGGTRRPQGGFARARAVPPGAYRRGRRHPSARRRP